MDHGETAQARDCLDTLVDRAGETGEHIILTRDGKPVAAIVHFEEAEYLQSVEDRLDLEAAEETRADVEKHGTNPWEEIEARLDGRAE